MKQTSKNVEPGFSARNATFQAGSVALAVIFTFAFSGCGQAKKNPSAGAGTNQQKTMAPDRVAVAQVGITLLGELSHIERALKPYFGVSMSTPPTGLVPAGLSCKTTRSTRLTQWETVWRCGLDSAERGRKEIEGVERLNFDSATRILTYTAKFETRNFDDNEPREKAHTLVTGRKIRINFTAESSDSSAIGTFRMSSVAALKNLELAGSGSNWSSSVSGVIRKSGGVWSLGSGAVMSLKGALYGRDSERKTIWASGDYNFVSDADTVLAGLADSACTKPVGPWRVKTEGGGKTFDTTLTSTLTTVFEGSGSSLNWPADLCDQP